MTRFALMKHLLVLESANLVVTRLIGAEEASTPKPGPDPTHPQSMDRQVHRAPRVGACGSQARAGGGSDMTKAVSVTTQVYRVYIKATPQAVWDAITRAGMDGKVRVRRAQHVRPSSGRYVPWIHERRHENRPARRGAAKCPTLRSKARLSRLMRLESSCSRGTWPWMPRRPLTQSRGSTAADSRQSQGGVTKLTLIHDLEGAPQAAQILSVGRAGRGRRLELGLERSEVAPGDGLWILSGRCVISPDVRDSGMTRFLLACGIATGPLFFGVATIQAFTRAGRPYAPECHQPAQPWRPGVDPDHELSPHGAARRCKRHWSAAHAEGPAGGAGERFLWAPSGWA